MFLFFGKDGQENVFDDVLERKHYENIELQKSKNIFFQRDQSMVSVKNWQFFDLFISGKKDKANVFYDILERKTLFQTIKTSIKRSKNQDFSMVSVKNQQLFLPFILSKIGRECVFHEILKRKNALLECKSKKFKENLAFFQRVHGCA